MGTGIIFILFWAVCALFTSKEKLDELVQEEIREGLSDGSIERRVRSDGLY